MADENWMSQALTLAALGRGSVEPNPMVGCIVVKAGTMIASGYHRRFGGPHAEVEALKYVDIDDVKDATVYVSLEPCSHFGKTPPCIELLAQLRPARVVVAMQDPFPEVSGKGVASLRELGIRVDVGVLKEQAEQLNAPYLKLLQSKRPWVIAKWAMTLDGAIATRTHDSKWISNEQSRDYVHRERARVDAVVVGIGTVLADDPLLTARLPPGESLNRIATRIVLDRHCRISKKSRLVQSIDVAPLMVVVSEDTDSTRIADLRDLGCEILLTPKNLSDRSLEFLLEHLGDRKCTNILIEGGGKILGAAFDANLVDEVLCFIAPKIIGGSEANRPVAGIGTELVRQAAKLERVTVQKLASDILVRGIIPSLADNLPKQNDLGTLDRH